MERLWRSLKYEDVYLRDYADCLEEAASPFGSHSTAADAHIRRCTPMAVSRDGVTGALTHGCGHDGQRKSFAHMPTAATTAADGTHRSMISGGRSSRVSN
jgi:hypothetical protein